jgi:uncharacterized membrane protein
MALMALDHVRLYFTAAQFDPVSIGETNAAYFITRWVTHLCAPGFFFLAGLSVSLAESRGLRAAQSTALLMTRGVWLIFLELTVIGFAWSFSPGWFWYGVIWSLGASMICLGLLRWAPKGLLLLAAGAFILTHNLLPMQRLLQEGDAYALLYGSGTAGETWVIFPLLPWLCVMILGYAGGDWLAPAGRPRPERFLACGAGALLCFLLFRASGFGEPEHGGFQQSAVAVNSVLSFFNVEKYPPSTQYVLVTLGVLLLFIGALGRRRSNAPPRLLAPLHVFGRVPFFFYLLHIFLIHGLVVLAAFALGWPRRGLIWNAEPSLVPPDGFGLGLAGVYAVWLVVLALLLPVCTAFARMKAASTGWWTKYL